ncbi:MAG: class I SAM-dependent methyltransferase [Bdellovibrionaceae bacterium]|nr:class I SAM-dependent methyltransferase [Pseudobdellovibrionaceae bacterium]
MASNHESTRISYSSSESLKARSELFERLQNYQATPEEMERSLGLFVRGSLLARFFGIREVYEKIVNKPGIIIDLGTWRGQTAVLCENLRAIFEPLHLNRRIVCFDTFEGYKGFSSKDKPSEIHKDGTYKVQQDYAIYLQDLLEIHEKNNAMGHNFGKHKVLKGDCREKLKEFFATNSHEVVALAFFDVNSYDPTLKSFEMIYDRLVPGGIVAFWQLTRESIPAEGMVYATEIMQKYKHEIFRSQFYPGLCYIKKEGI